MWKFFRNIQSSLAALVWLIVPVSFLVYCFAFRPFSWSFIFTTFQKALMRHWRRQRICLFIYLDDGARGDSNFCEAQQVSDMVRQDVQHSGFVANDAKR